MSVSGYNTNQFHSGPGGALASTELALVELYALLSKSNLQYAYDNIKIACQLGKAASDADVAAGQDQAWATKSQAIQSSINAGLTAASAITAVVKTKNLNAEADNTQSELKGLEKVDSQIQQSLKRAPDVQMRQQNATNSATDANVAARIKELKDQDYKTQLTGNATNPNTTYEEEITQKAVDAMDPDELKEVRKTLQSNISDKYESLSKTYNQINQVRQQYDQFFKVAEQTTAAGAQFGQAASQAKQGVDQGIAALANSSASLTSSMLATEREQSSSFYNMIATVLQALKAASSAYAG